MKRSFLMQIILAISLLHCQAQGAGNVFSGDSYRLKCQMTVYLKNGEQINGKFSINGTDTKKLKVAYSEIDSIKTEKYGTYMYVDIGKKKPVLFKRIVGGKGLSIFEARAKMKTKGGAPSRNSQGQVTGISPSSFSIHRKFFFQKKNEIAIEFPKKGKDLINYFADYPCLIEKYKDEAVYGGMNPYIFVQYYDTNCEYVETFLNDGMF